MGNRPRNEDGAKPIETTQEHQKPTQEQGDNKEKRVEGKRSENEEEERKENKQLVECHQHIRIQHSETSHNDKMHEDEVEEAEKYPEQKKKHRKIAKKRGEEIEEQSE